MWSLEPCLLCSPLYSGTWNSGSHITGPQKAVFWTTDSQRGTKSGPSRRDSKRVWTSSRGNGKLVQKLNRTALTKFNFFFLGIKKTKTDESLTYWFLTFQASWPVILPSSATCSHVAQPVLRLTVLKQKGHWVEIREPSPASTHNRLCDSGQDVWLWSFPLSEKWG